MSNIQKAISITNALLLATVAVLFFLPQCRIESQAYQSTLTGLNLTLGTTPYTHVEGMSDADYQKLVDMIQGIRQTVGQPKLQDYTNPAFLGVLLLSASRPSHSSVMSVKRKSIRSVFGSAVIFGTVPWGGC